MRTLSLILLAFPAIALMSLGMRSGDNPHGKDFQLSCDLCHTSSNWKFDPAVSRFDHQTTRFALQGQHQVTGCRQCHSSLVFSEAPTACAGCHTDLHYQTVGPDCERCHTPKSWIVNNITEIHQRSRFPLAGPHFTATCDQCHPSASLLRFDPRGVTCYDCHRSDYESTTQPNHVQGGYPTDCAQCHLMTSFTWTGSGIDHSFFPLTQGHALTECGKCHINGNYNIPSTCVSCHQDVYNASTNPSHTGLVLPNTCEQCHTTMPGWKPATFAIHNNYYVLEGAHAAIASNCSGCHNGNYNNTPNTCIGCHQDEYNQSTNPPHAAAQFPTDCQSCHSQNVWVPSTFNHDGQYFPIYSGKHSGEWSLCSDCHTNPGNYQIYSCIDCHEHNQQDMDDEHDEVPGYAYNSIACFNCHPSGVAPVIMHKTIQRKQD